MVFLYFLISFVIGIFFDMLVAGSSVAAAVPAFTLIVLFYWFIRIPLSMRLWLAVSAGIVIDELFLYSFGTAALVLGGLACCTEWIARSLRKTESLAVQVLFMFVLLCAFWVLVGPAEQAVESFVGMTNIFK